MDTFKSSDFLEIGNDNEPIEEVKEIKSFLTEYIAFPVSTLIEQKSFNYVSKAEKSDRIIIPQDALGRLTTFNIPTPFHFKITNPKTGLATYVGVYDYNTTKRDMYLPNSIMDKLALSPGSRVNIIAVDIPKGIKVKFKTQKDFANLEDPLLVLKRKMRNVHTLVKGDVIKIVFVNKEFILEVEELEPTFVVSTVNTNLNVEFNFF